MHIAIPEITGLFMMVAVGWDTSNLAVLTHIDASGTVCESCCIEYGDDCNACENPGGLWDDGATPKYVEVVFSGITTPDGWDDPPTDSWILKQINPCQWKLILSGWTVWWIPSQAPTQSACSLLGPDGTYYWEVASECLVEFSDNHAYLFGGPNDGQSEISWGSLINESAYDAQFA